MSNAQRAIAAAEYPRDPTDRDRLREEWRLLSLDAARKKDAACRLEEGRKILLSVMVTRLVEGGLPVSKAENEARASAQFQDHVQAMHEARLAADEAWIAAENADRIYWANVSEEANARTERRLSR